jgi:hypothetical protein
MVADLLYRRFCAKKKAFTMRTVGSAMSFRSGLRKPGQASDVRHSWRAYMIIGLMGLIGVVVLLMLRGSPE